MNLVASKKHTFKLSQEVVDYQITVHYNNYEACYGKGSFVKQLHNQYRDAVMHNLCIHYGQGTLERFIKEYIYAEAI